MNIGFLVSLANPKVPNASPALYNRVTEMIKLLSGDNKITLYNTITYSEGVSLPFCNTVFIRAAHPIMVYIKILRKLFEDRKKLDVLIAYNPQVYTSSIMFLKLLCSVPIVVDYVDKRGMDVGGRLHGVLDLVNLIIEKLFLLMINNWFTDSKHLENEIKRFKKNANILFYRGTFSKQPCLNEKTESFPVIVNKDTINIAYMGALYPIHGVDVLLNAFSKLTFENVHLYITGYGPMKSVLENTIEKKKISNVNIMHLDYDVVHKFMSKMDILVLPNKNTKRYITGFPSKIIEYMWAGKAIISTTIGEDMLDIFENGKTAILIEPENEAALRIALANLITDEKKRKELGINARRYFEDNLSEKVVKSKINEYLNDIVNTKRLFLREEK